MNSDPRLVTIGPHRVAHASIDDPLVDRMLREFGAVRVLYVDPPWGDRMMKFFASLNRKQTGEVVQPIAFQSLLRRVFDLGSQYVRGYVCMETGSKGLPGVLSAFEKAGLVGTCVVQTTYDKGLECDVVVGATAHEFVTPAMEALPAEAVGQRLKGVALPRYIVGQLGAEGEGVFDPCCGMGYSAKAAVHHRMRFAGNELNSHRLQKTISYLSGVV